MTQTPIETITAWRSAHGSCDSDPIPFDIGDATNVDEAVWAVLRAGSWHRKDLLYIAVANALSGRTMVHTYLIQEGVKRYGDTDPRFGNIKAKLLNKMRCDAFAPTPCYSSGRTPRDVVNGNDAYLRNVIVGSSVNA